MDSPELSPAAPPEQASNAKRNRTIIIIVAAVLGLCLIACVAVVLALGFAGRRISQNVETSPQDVSTTADAIAAFDLPAGFTPQSSIHLLGISFVTYENTSSDSAIFLVQMPTQGELNDANIQQLQQQLERQTGMGSLKMQTVDEYETTVRGQPAQVTIQEGTNANEETFRQMMVVFQGKGGLAMMSIYGPASTWDQAAYDQLVKSIR